MKKAHPLTSVVSFYKSLKEFYDKSRNDEIIRSGKALSSFVEAMHNRAWVEDLIACHFSVDWASYLYRVLEKAADQAHWSDQNKSPLFFANWGLLESSRRPLLITRTIISQWLTLLFKGPADVLLEAVPAASINFLEWLSVQGTVASIARIPEPMVEHDLLVNCEALGLVQFSLWYQEEDLESENGYVRDWYWIEERMPAFELLPLRSETADRNAPGDPNDHPFVRLSDMGSRILELTPFALERSKAHDIDAGEHQRRNDILETQSILANPDIQIDQKSQTIRVGNKVLQWGGSVAWECFIALWKARPSPVDLKLRYEHQKASDIVSEVRKFLRDKGLGQLADALKSSKNVGYYFDLPS